MRPLKVYSVTPKLPDKLTPLWDLAYNFWFSWKHEISELFERIDYQLWRKCRQNPVKFLNLLSQEVIEDLAEDVFFLDRLNQTRESLEKYRTSTKTVFEFEGVKGEPVIAYFSAEYGISLSLPIYSGGLGVLAGDHLKSASDLNLPLVAIGLCYQKGYFRQYLTGDGWQQERYPVNDFEEMPLSLVRNEQGEPVSVEVELLDRTVRINIWKAVIGRISLYLLDTNLNENMPQDREITAQLYGGDWEMRLKQEIVLGVGGIRAMHALNLNPRVIHMNEGHSAFAGLERISIFMREHSMSFEAAMELVASSSVFTTHTPVPAGNDRFAPELMQKYFDSYAREIGLAFKVFMALGREDPRDDQELFCMTVLALRLSRFNNGVSQLHGKVARNMWKKVWPQYPVDDVPIAAITNGIHIPTWIAPDMAYLFDRYLGSDWREDPDCQRVWKQSQAIPDAELWRTRERLRERLVDFVRTRLKEQTLARGGRRYELQLADEVLDPGALTIGFARRFATYKRANLILTDVKRILEIMNNKKQPVQFIFAGKAHPKDVEGKKLIQEIVQFCRNEDCRHHFVFLEDYDMEIGGFMLQGCDVWLNNPRRPLEACGTSGMKAVANGVLNFSVLDGWWDEAYTPDNRYGWSIGEGEEYQDQEYQNLTESHYLYNVLEKDVIPTFYNRSTGNLPMEWIRKMKDGLRDLAPMFSSHRMVEDYSRTAYLPAYQNFVKLEKNGFEQAKNLASWRMDLMTKWSDVKIRNVRASTEDSLHSGEELVVTAEVFINGLSPQDILVEIYSGGVDMHGDFANRKTVQMEQADSTGDGWMAFQGRVVPDTTGRFGYTVRILPHHPLLLDPHCLGLIHWA
ncbi:alpha-glucan family phosphorylase [Desulfonatronovibrio hydrogenovorans]|uniref:alpha-glucan family phosphorylase n=1 Tax=Desulfonatronovibrio hydrogenovorans TaxID=53245 RepID=UPI00048B208A|nr:alpha-glucan family phosphorylase [Desulfonatronovibrio hydrogenovorans]